jgi:hypothetical protein
MNKAPAVTFSSKELFDRRALQIIVDNWEAIQIPPESREPWVVNGQVFSPVAIMSSYLRKAIPGHDCCLVPVTYISARDTKSGGRQFAKGAQSLQGMAREVRHTIAGKLYDDIDMVNAHPVILRQYCEKMNWPCPVLAAYVDDRDTLLAEITTGNGCSRDHAKKVILALMNGGQKDYQALQVKPTWLERFQYEVACIQATMVIDPNNAELVKSVKAKKGQAYQNVGGSVCNHVLCALENKLLMACIDFLKDQGISIDNVVLVFDGFMLPKSGKDITAAFLKSMAKFVKKRTTYSISLSVKKMDECLDLTGFAPAKDENEPRACYNDREASDIFVTMIEGRVLACGEQIFALTNDRVWTRSPASVHKVMMSLCQKANIFKVDSNKNTVHYSSNLHGSETIVKLTKFHDDFPNDPELKNNIFEKSIGKVFFKDGVYDFLEGRFRTETDDDMTAVRIPRCFPKVRNEEKMKELWDRVFMTVFGTAELANFFLAHCARALAGMVLDKKWVVCQGERNCGKGVLSTLLENAWGDYISIADSDSFLMERNSGGDVAKKLAWLLDCEFARVILTNEITVDRADKTRKINGAMIKGKLCSGGDTLLARKNYIDQLRFRLQGRLFMMCNDLPPVSPADAMETMHMIAFPNQFVDEITPDSMEFMKLKDDRIKAFCAERETCDAFICLVLDAFSDTSVVPPDCVKKETETYRAEGGDEWSMMKESFEVTRKAEDKISSTLVADVIRMKEANIGIQKVRARLQLMGARYSENVVIDGKRCRGFTGVKLTEECERDLES